MAAPARQAALSAPWRLLRGRGGRATRRPAEPLAAAALAPLDTAGLAPLDTRTDRPVADPAWDTYPRVPAPAAAPDTAEATAVAPDSSGRAAAAPGTPDMAAAAPAVPGPATATPDTPDMATAAPATSFTAAGGSPANSRAHRTPAAAIAAAGRGPWAAAPPVPPVVAHPPARPVPPHTITATAPTRPAPPATPAPMAPLTATLPPALTHYAPPAAASPVGAAPAPAGAALPTAPGGAPVPAAPPMSLRDRLWNAGVTGLTFLRRLVLALAIGMVAWSLIPVAFGWQTAVIVTGSMHPAVRVGDVVATAPVRTEDVSRLPAGSVLLMDDPAKPGTLLLHRLVKHRDDGTLITKGDANRSRDSTPVPPQNVKGVARLRVPSVGLPVLWARQGEWAPLAAVVLLVGIVVFWQPPRPEHS